MNLIDQSMPQLRLRSEFSFRQTFAPVGKLADAVAAMGTPAAGIVDAGTWGHVKWAGAAKERFKPLFGRELTLKLENGQKPTAWWLAGHDTKAFYSLSTEACRPDADVAALFAKAAGKVVRFSGAALNDPELFDFVDINPGSALAARRGLELSRNTGKPLVLTSDNWYPSTSDLGSFLAIGGRERTSPQWIMPASELRKQFTVLSDKDFESALHNTHAVVQQCATKLPTAPLIKVEGDILALANAGKADRLARGHIAEWTEAYEARFQRELQLIAEKEFESYFIVVADLIRWAKERMLVGPGRGSSAGSLICYLLRITEVDPLVYGLLFERFIDLNRKDLPDIDIDFADSQRDSCFDYLAEKYGRDCVARIGNINRLRAKSVISEVCKRFAIPDREKYDVFNVLIDYSSGDSRYGHALEDTMSQTEPGKRFSAAHPEAAVMYGLENHASHTGVHAAGVIVCNDPVSNYCTIGADGVAHIDKPDSETLNLLKIDALGLRTLGVIQDAGVVTGEELFNLKLNDPEVFRVFNEKKFSGMFQFEGQAQRRVSSQVLIDSFEKIDHVTALARPGPLGGGAAGHYIGRAAGREEFAVSHPALLPILKDTYGVVLYQEQVMRIVRDIGKFSWEETTAIRKAMSGRKGKEYFDRQGVQFFKGAAEDGIERGVAETIWNEICTFGAWGMNKSHTCSYAVISYWCAWMKRYHGLAYAAAALRNAKDEEQTYALLRELNDEGVQYIAFDIDRSGLNWQAVDGVLVGGFLNLEGFGPSKASKAVEDRNAGKLTPAARAKILAAKVSFGELRPLHAAWGDLFRNPENYGARSGSRVYQIAEFPDEGELLTLVRVVRKEIRDENETVRLARRGKRLEGQTLFLDIFVTDDSGEPFTLRIDRFKYEQMGKRAAEMLSEGDVLLCRLKKIPNFAMGKVVKMKCMNEPEKLNA